MFERDYLDLGVNILLNGEEVQGRNGKTKQLFAEKLTADLSYGLPLLTTRKCYYKGVAGEFAAFMNAPFNNEKHLKKFGVNYWKKWAGPNGELNLDYGNEGERILPNGKTQMEEIIDRLQNNPHDRRIILNYWNVDHIYNSENPLSLPCCFYAIQFHVRENKYLDILWNQRSADLAIGVAADIILASLFSIVIGNQVGLLPGKITMMFGNVHLYEEHWCKFLLQDKRDLYLMPMFKLNMEKGQNYKDFRPDMLEVVGYNHHEPINYELKA